MKNLYQTLLCSLLITSSFAAKAYDGIEHSYANLLVNNSTVGIKLVAQSLYGNPNKHEQIFDIAAEVLAQNCNTQSTLSVDTKAWLVKALGNSKKLRYQDVIQNCHTQYSNAKYRKYSDIALNQLSISASSYQAGSLKLERIQAQLANPKNRKSKKNLRDAFANVRISSPVAEVFELLDVPNKTDINEAGAPSKQAYKVSIWAPWRNFTNAAKTIKQHAARIVLVYDQVGAVQVNQVQAGKWFVEAVYPWDTETQQLGAEAHAANALYSPDALVLRAEAKRLFVENQFEGPLLDIAAKRVQTGAQTTDPHMIDALSWLCKYIGKSRDQKYAAVLQDVKQNAAHKKLRKYAAAGLELMGVRE